MMTMAMTKKNFIVVAECNRIAFKQAKTHGELNGICNVVAAQCKAFVLINPKFDVKTFIDASTDNQMLSDRIQKGADNVTV
jgi:hypothetical protein